jgi:exportin-1
LDDLIAPAEGSRGLLLNNLNIFFLFCQDVLETGEETMLSHRYREVKSRLSKYARPIYDLVERLVSTMSDDPDVVLICLKVLKYFIRWLEPHHILQSQFFQGVSRALLPQVKYVNPVLGLFHEIFGTAELSELLKQAVPEIFSLMIEAISPLMPETEQAFEDLLLTDNEFLRILPMTVSVFLEQYGHEIEKPERVGAIQSALQWMLVLSRVPDVEAFKICVDFWHSVALRVQQERRNPDPTALSIIYGPRLPDIRRIHVSRMASPIDLLDADDVQEERNTLNQVQFATMKETLAILTSVDPGDTLAAIDELMQQLRVSWNCDVYTRVCWSAGAITKTLHVDAESEFLCALLRDLFAFCEQLREPEELAAAASGVMYVCSQYPRFLGLHPAEFQEVLNRLFDFMRVEYGRVQAMAVQSFHSITSSCKRKLHGPDFIGRILDHFNAITAGLPPRLLPHFVDACAQIVATEVPGDATLALVRHLLAPLNERWCAVFAASAVSDAVAGELTTVLLCNAAVAQQVPKAFREQLGAIFPQMMDAYATFARDLAQTVVALGPLAARHEEVQRMKSVKVAVLAVLRNCVERAHLLGGAVEALVPRIITDVVEEYGESPPDARVPEVLALLEALCKSMEEAMRLHWPVVFAAGFQKTVQMVADDFEANVGFRFPMFSFLKTLIEKYLPVLFSASAEDFDGLMQCLVHGMSHPTPDVCTVSLSAIERLFNGVMEAERGLVNSVAFLQAYYLKIVGGIFDVIQDTYHKFAFEEECGLLQILLKIQCEEASPGAIAAHIHPMFPQIVPDDLLEFVQRMITVSTNKMEFRQVVRNFLVASRQFSAAELTQIDRISQRRIGEAALISVQGNDESEIPGIV